MVTKPRDGDARLDAPALRMRGVTFAYAGREPVLRDVDLDVPRGKVTVILGPNGSGKSTLLRLAAGLVRPQHGTITLGADGAATAAKASRAGRIGYIPQQLGLVRSASALDNALMGGIAQHSRVSSFLGLLPASARDDALAALETVGLREKAAMPVKNLSGGERQRVAIARTLVQKPDVIVADELIASLDAVQAGAVMELQDELRKRGVAVLMSLHQIDVALAHADRLVFLSKGHLGAPRAPEGVSAEEARCALAP